MDNLYALIMAGGGGTRLWPLSRRDRPKQMLPLVEDRSMFQVAVDRLKPLIPVERIFVVTGSDYVDHLRHNTPELPPENFVVEPVGRNTAPAVALGAAYIRHRDPDAVIAVLTADHHIAQKPKFRNVLTAAAELAQAGYITTLGISPSYPATGFGYIRRGEPLTEVNGFQAYHAANFTEKPDKTTAINFVASGLYSWNSGMFIWTVDQVFAEFKRQQPDMYVALCAIADSIGTPDEQPTLARMWPQMTKLSIDYAIMENAESMAVIPVDIGWSDVGSWGTLYEVLHGDSNGNVVRGQAARHIPIDTVNSLVVSDRMVVTIGLRDVVIVDTEDVLLVAHRERSEDVRRVVDQLKVDGDSTHL